jgi:MFS family permease
LAQLSQPGRIGLIDQWGGKLSFFFTYTHFSHDLTTGLLAALLPFIRQDLGINYLQSGFLVSAFALTAGFSQFLGGWLCDRISPRKAIAIGLGGIGLTAAATGFANSYYFLLVILIAMGLFAGFYHPSAVSTLTNKFEEQRRGRVIALHMVGGSLGFGIGPFLGAIIADKLNWHVAYLLLGLPALIAAPLAFSRLRPVSSVRPSGEATSSQDPSQKPIGIWQVFNRVLGVYVISIAMQLVTGPVMSFFSLFLVDVHHLSQEASSMWVTVVRMGGLVGSLFGGWLTDHWGRRNTILLTLALFGPVVFLLVKLPFGVALVILFIIFGWLMAMREATMQTYLMDNTPAPLRGTVFGIYFGFGQQGSSIIQPVAGSFMDSLGITGVFNIIAFVSIGLSTLAIISAARYFRRI